MNNIESQLSVEFVTSPETRQYLAVRRGDDVAPGKTVEPCRDADYELFTAPEYEKTNGPDAVKRVAKAKAICGTCAVKDACLKRGLEMDDQHSIYGGLTPEERRQLKATSKKSA